MKRLFLITSTIFPLFAFADIIATYNNGNIEDVTVVSMSADEVVYKEGEKQNTIASSEVGGVLYDDGRYVSPPKKAVADSFDTPSNGSWEVDDVATDSQTATSNNRQKREPNERSGSTSEVGKAFREAGVAIKGAFTTMFDAIDKKFETRGKKKDKTTSESPAQESDANSPSPASSDDNW